MANHGCRCSIRIGTSYDFIEFASAFLWTNSQKSKRQFATSSLGIKAYAISILSVDRGEGGIFYSDWSDALINDFSEEGDNVIIALHGSTDYKDPKMINVYLKKESEELSKKYNRSIRLHVFNHQEGSGYIKPTLQLNSLTDIWNKLDSYGR